MEILTIIFILALSYVVLCFKDYGWGVRIFYIVTFIIGMFILTENTILTTPDMVYTIITAQSTESFLLFVVVCFGSLIGMTYKTE
jgi:hypothetical protein